MIPLPTLVPKLFFLVLGLLTVLFWISPTRSPRGRAFIIFLLIFGLGPSSVPGAFHILCSRRRFDESALLTPNYGRFYTLSDGTKIWWNGWPVMEEIGLNRFYIFSQRKSAQKMLDEFQVSLEPISDA